MHNKLAISVIIPVFNSEKFIGRCLRSLLNQSMPADCFEIIVVNDGSTDRTGYALEQFAGPVKTLTHIHNKGLPASVNSGIKIAQGEYIVRVDSDDYVNREFLTILAMWLECNEEFDGVACDYYIVDDAERILERKKAADDPIACGILFNKSHLKSLGLYDESFRVHEDKDMMIRYRGKFRLGHVSLPLYRYRRHEGNLTNDVSKDRFYREKLATKHKNYFED